jgi:hypothetical protein
VQDAARGDDLGDGVAVHALQRAAFEAKAAGAATPTARATLFHNVPPPISLDHLTQLLANFSLTNTSHHTSPTSRSLLEPSTISTSPAIRNCAKIVQNWSEG